MSDVEFFAKLNPKPFKSLAKIEQERVEAIKKARLKTAGKSQLEPGPEYTRETFSNEGYDQQWNHQ